MLVALICNDTRGGIEPYVALALGLREAGVSVRAIAPGTLCDAFETRGFEVARLDGDVQAVLTRSGGAAQRGIIASMRLAARELPARLTQWTQQTLEALDGCDLAVGGLGGMVTGQAAAEKRGIPFVEAHLVPMFAPTHRYPGLLLSRARLGWSKRLTRWSHRLSDAALMMSFRTPMLRVRRQLGLPRAAAPTSSLVLYGFSPHVVPMPTEGPRQRVMTGYWRLPDASAPSDPELETFLSQPGPVVAVGFGSMPNTDALRLTRTIAEAVSDAGARLIALGGWGGLKDYRSSADALFRKSVPHSWLYPRVAAIVHHGGAGTTGAALRSGVPSIVVPFTMDQPFWAQRVAALGVGPQPIPRKKLTKQRLQTALQQALGDPDLRQKSQDLGARLRAEDGVGRAVTALLERFDSRASIRA